MEVTEPLSMTMYPFTLKLLQEINSKKPPIYMSMYNVTYRPITVYGSQHLLCMANIDRIHIIPLRRQHTRESQIFSEICILPVFSSIARPANVG